MGKHITHVAASVRQRLLNVSAAKGADYMADAVHVLWRKSIDRPA